MKRLAEICGGQDELSKVCSVNRRGGGVVHARECQPDSGDVRRIVVM